MFRSPFLIFITLTLLISCSKQDKKSAVKFNSKEEKAIPKDVFIAKAEAYRKAKIFDSAFYYYHQSKELAIKNKDSATISYDLINMAASQQVFGDYFGSESTLIEAIPYLNNDTDYTTALYNCFGIAAKELNNWEDARKHYLQAKKYSNKVIAKIVIDNNIGVILTHEKKYHEAISLFQKLLKQDTLQKKEYFLIKASVQDNLGFAMYKNGNPKVGLANMQQALRIRLQEKETYKSIESYLHLADFYEKKNPNIAAQNALKAYQNATQLNGIEERLKALLFLIKVAPKKEYVIKYASLNDSIMRIRNTAKNQFAKIKYDARKISEENLILKNQKTATELELQKTNNNLILLYFGIVMLLIVIVWIIYHWRNKNKQERVRVTYSTETRIAKKIHDELANDVFQTMAFAETQDLVNPEKKEKLLQNLDHIYTRTRNISKENSTIAMEGNYIEDVKKMLNSYSTEVHKVIIKDAKEIDWQKIASEKKVALYRILQEIMVNMKKHSQSTFAIVSFENGSKSIQVNYSDNGIGCSMDEISRNGLLNAENRIKSIHGSITFESQSNKGFKVKISFPK